MSDHIKLQNAFETIKGVYRNDIMCTLTQPQIDEYKKKLERFEKVNTNKKFSTKEKGDALENISKYLLEISGGLFEITKNLRTSTNEIDLLMQLSTEKRILINYDFIDKRLTEFIAECKNYDKTVNVTYVGKLISLMDTNKINFAILFSYHGISGKGWSNASGLIKKYYLSKESVDERPCIIDFNYENFCDILNGNNLLDIINNKISALRYDTDYKNFIK